MKPISEQEIVEAVAALVRSANVFLPQDVEETLLNARDREEAGGNARTVLEILCENACIARETGLPICQDTGIDVVFVHKGESAVIDGDLPRAISDGIARGTQEGLLRSSVCDPLTRKNTGDNTPAVIHVETEPGARLQITVLPKGCGSENMSALFLLPPSVGVDGIVHSVVGQVKKAGPNPCPPGVIGVGIGGTMEMAAFLAKKALLRPIGSRHERQDVAELEDRILAEINKLGIGPHGFGGNTTTLGVSAEVFPCHIASLPVAVNIQCHAARRASATWNWTVGTWDFTTPSLRAIAPDKAPATFPRAKRMTLPLLPEDARSLCAGDWVLLTGTLFTGRDQTHKRLIALLDEGKALPFDPSGQLIYYVGPTPAPAGRPIGSAGPTTSYRMDAYTPRLLEAGIRATMGKGKRSPEVKEAMQRTGAVYLATIGGAGAYLARCIESCELVAFSELGPEAMFRMEVKDFPAVVIVDTEGKDLYDLVLKGNGRERPA